MIKNGGISMQYAWFWPWIWLIQSLQYMTDYFSKPCKTNKFRNMDTKYFAPFFGKCNQWNDLSQSLWKCDVFSICSTQGNFGLKFDAPACLIKKLVFEMIFSWLLVLACDYSLVKSELTQHSKESMWSHAKLIILSFIVLRYSNSGNGCSLLLTG